MRILVTGGGGVYRVAPGRAADSAGPHGPNTRQLLDRTPLHSGPLLQNCRVFSEVYGRESVAIRLFNVLLSGRPRGILGDGELTVLLREGLSRTIDRTGDEMAAAHGRLSTR